MTKKFFLTFIITLFLVLTLCSYSFATENVMNKAKNTVMNTGNTIGNALINTKNTIVDGTTTISKNATQSSQNYSSNLDNVGSTYTATRTSTNSNLLGLTNSTWTWMVFGIVSIVIVALVWYYGAQFEHKNYDNE